MDNAGIEQRMKAYRAAFDLSGKTALVLGAASGIGKASAEALAALGADVICADNNRDGVERTAAEIGTRVKSQAHVVDAGNAGDIRTLAARRDKIGSSARYRRDDAGDSRAQDVSRLFRRGI
jgi:NAD(P)-dependent dehydrogenase (short-subunit alcohol dehydrogenase family)